MSNTRSSSYLDVVLPREQLLNKHTSIEAPSYENFTTRFGNVYPQPTYLKSQLGTTAVYNLPAKSGVSKQNILIIHGLNTPALGMVPLACELQNLDQDAHIVLFDLWGHGLSSTPLVAHTQHIFHFQIYQVLSYMKWTSAHVIGYSFGGETAVRFTIANPWIPQSVVLLAPAGLLREEMFDEHLRGLLADTSKERQDEAIDSVLGWLEGGPLVVPADEKERVQRGEVVAEALRHWNLDEHQGYPHSVLSMFRDGGICGGEEDFGELARLDRIKKLVVLAESDIVGSESQFRDLGFGDVQVVKNANHAFVRGQSVEVARIIDNFWKQP